jgi:hypothetical protein
MAICISATLTVRVDLKVGENTAIKNLIEHLECNCTERSRVRNFIVESYGSAQRPDIYCCRDYEDAGPEISHR